jgi:hypothetical protein
MAHTSVTSSLRYTTFLRLKPRLMRSLLPRYRFSGCRNCQQSGSHHRATYAHPILCMIAFKSVLSEIRGAGTWGQKVPSRMQNTVHSCAAAVLVCCIKIC